jgi:two-component system KDP operon response regulator KdpE
VGPLSIDFARRQVELSGQDVSLTPTEFDLLKVFIVHRGKILTRQMLLKEIWGDVAHARTHSLHALLRQKIEPHPDRPRFVITIPGVGYRFSETEES